MRNNQNPTCVLTEEKLVSYEHFVVNLHLLGTEHHSLTITIIVSTAAAKGGPQRPSKPGRNKTPVMARKTNTSKVDVLT